MNPRLPQEDHADLGLVDDDLTEDLRKENAPGSVAADSRGDVQTPPFNKGKNTMHSTQTSSGADLLCGFCGDSNHIPAPMPGDVQDLADYNREIENFEQRHGRCTADHETEIAVVAAADADRVFLILDGRTRVELTVQRAKQLACDIIHADVELHRARIDARLAEDAR